MIDNQSIDITCNDCGHKTHKQIGWIKRNKQLTCHCGTTISLDCKQMSEECRKFGKMLKGCL